MPGSFSCIVYHANTAEPILAVKFTSVKFPFKNYEPRAHFESQKEKEYILTFAEASSNPVAKGRLLNLLHNSYEWLLKQRNQTFLGARTKQVGKSQRKYKIPSLQPVDEEYTVERPVELVPTVERLFPYEDRIDQDRRLLDDWRPLD